MKYVIVARVETLAYGTIENSDTFTDFTATVNKYNEVVREIREREHAGEIKDWNVSIIFA